MFSDSELQLALNRDVFLTKNRIIGLVYEQFGEIGRVAFNVFDPLKSKFPEALDILPKISKGENYEGLPWVMLDYPRNFNNHTGHFAGRILFWWGNYFLVQVQVSGKFLPDFLNLINQGLIPMEIKNYPVLAGFIIDPWDYKLPQKSLISLNQVNKPFQIETDKIFKLVISVPIEQYEDVKEVSLSLFQLLVAHWPMD